MSEPPEELIWRGASSHVRNFWLYVACWAFCWLVVPFLIWLWRWLELRNRIYELTTERLKITQGIFSRRSDDLELYRVRDTAVSQPFLYRLFNRADIVLNTTDTTTPTVVLECVPDPFTLRDRLRAAVEACRDRKRARVAELNGPLDVDADGTPLA